MRTIFLIDMNAFFASVEQAANPALRGKPIVVCGEGRTVVTTASYEARKLGVKTAMSLYEAKRACPQVIQVYGDMNKYVDASHRIHRILLEYTDLVEVFSIDECFVDVSHLCKREGDAKRIAREIKAKIKERLGLLCSAGIGPNKVVAKIACKMQKPDGLVEIKSEDIDKVFSGLPVEKLQGVGVGSKTSAKLNSLGIRTAGELGKAPIDLLMHHFGVIGCYLKNIGLGKDESPVKQYFEYEQAKSVGHSRTLDKDTWNLTVIKAYIMMLSEKVGVRLRASKMEGSTINFFVRYGDFTHFSVQHNLKQPIKNSSDIYSQALKLFERALPLKKAVRMLGVSISGLSRESSQEYLFDEYSKKDKAVQTLDRINKEYGPFTIKPSSVLIAEKFGIDEGCGMVDKSRKKFSAS